MKVNELMEQLAKIDPEEDIFMFDSENGAPVPILHVDQAHHHAISAHGRVLPKMVWCIY